MSFFDPLMSRTRAGSLKWAVDDMLTMRGAFNFAAKYKYDAWKKLEGMSKEDAMAKYVELLKSVSQVSTPLVQVKPVFYGRGA